MSLRFAFLIVLTTSLAANVPASVARSVSSEAEPSWLDAAGRPRDVAWEALDLLADAAVDGLRPDDYAAAPLRLQAGALNATRQPRDRDRQVLETELSASVVGYLHDLHWGRIAPDVVGTRFEHQDTRERDVPALLRRAVDDQQLSALVASFRPQLPLYRQLRTELARYRAFSSGLRPPTLPADVMLRPGDVFPKASILADWLIALGAEPPQAVVGAAPPTHYDGSLVAAVMRFQERHGLAADGVIGPRTGAALQLPLEHRIRQIELAMERLRWLGEPSGERMVFVNIPMFRLWAWDTQAGDSVPRVAMNVIVGRARPTQTPVFAAGLREVVFRPEWDIPLSIQRSEIVPLLARDPSYLQRHAIDIVPGNGAAAAAVGAPVDAATVARLRAGSDRLRQRPGPQNALGLLKFVFPNPDSIFMHGTPVPQLFAEVRRDFSHGCVRLEDPGELAHWVLEDIAGWDAARIAVAMEGDETVRVRLARPVRVVMFYATALVSPDDGRVHFADDLYGLDKRLERALGNRPKTFAAVRVFPASQGSVLSLLRAYSAAVLLHFQPARNAMANNIVPRHLLTRLGIALGGLLVVAVTAASAQSAPPIQGTIATEGTMKKFYKAANTIIVATIDGVEHAYRFTKELLVDGKQGPSALDDLREGTAVAIHYRVDGSERQVLEIDDLNADGMMVTEGRVTKVDRGRRELTIRLSDGTTERLRLTENVVGEFSSVDANSEVRVFYRDAGGRKTVHYFKRIDK